MFRSRLRLRMAGWFALGILLGLALLDLGLFVALRRVADHQLTMQLRTAARGMREAVLRETTERPPFTLARAANEALAEWPTDELGLVILSADGVALGQRGPARLLAIVPPVAALPKPGGSLELPMDHEGARVVTLENPGPPAFTIVAMRSTGPLHEELETLAWWLILRVPLVLLVSLPAGYFLARRALAPFQSLAAELEAMRPGALDRRLPVVQPPDELDQLAQQVNHLLDRLEAAQRQTRRFLSQAAHQLRTPLTLIRGESAFAIEKPRAAEDYRTALDRVSRAADQMSRRVDELFLLARAEAGERVPRTEVVELDLVALEAADLMRGRAQSLGHRLELGRMDGAEAQGDAGLLREAALELLENACRHGDTGAPIVISVDSSAGRAALTVTSSGPVVTLEPTDPDGDGSGLGIAIVQWIAAAHGGSLEYVHVEGSNRFALVLRSTNGSAVTTGESH